VCCIGIYIRLCICHLSLSLYLFVLVFVCGLHRWLSDASKAKDNVGPGNAVVEPTPDVIPIKPLPEQARQFLLSKTKASRFDFETVTTFGERSGRRDRDKEKDRDTDTDTDTDADTDTDTDTDKDKDTDEDTGSDTDSGLPALCVSSIEDVACVDDGHGHHVSFCFPLRGASFACDLSCDPGEREGIHVGDVQYWLYSQVQKRVCTSMLVVVSASLLFLPFRRFCRVCVCVVSSLSVLLPLLCRLCFVLSAL
jgi:hypothetical protein